jgi:hypothetical protein
MLAYKELAWYTSGEFNRIELNSVVVALGVASLRERLDFDQVDCDEYTTAQNQDITTVIKKYYHYYYY